MATALLILQAIMAALKFPSELSAFIKLISKSPAEKRDEITKRILAEEEKFAETGRPTWD